MNSTDTPRGFASYLRETLIPDLRESGMDATADDLATCEQFISQLDTATLALLSIFHMPGNLTDAALETRTGPNDAAARGIMVTGMRALANEALEAMAVNRRGNATQAYRDRLADWFEENFCGYTETSNTEMQAWAKSIREGGMDLP